MKQTEQAFVRRRGGTMLIEAGVAIILLGVLTLTLSDGLLAVHAIRAGGASARFAVRSSERNAASHGYALGRIDWRSGGSQELSAAANGALPSARMTTRITTPASEADARQIRVELSCAARRVANPKRRSVSPLGLTKTPGGHRHETDDWIADRGAMPTARRGHVGGRMPTHGSGHGTRHCPCGTRRGFTLVEVLLSMSIGTVVFFAAVELLVVAMDTDSGRGAALRGVQSLDRLVEQFRDDVRHAIEIVPRHDGKAASGWTMKLPDNRRIEYAAKDQLLERTAYTAEKVSARDAFALADVSAGLELLPSGKPTTAGLILQKTFEVTAPREAKEMAAANAMRIIAPIGSDNRFAPPAKSEPRK